MASSFTFQDVINADVIECEVCKTLFSGMTAFVGHPCIEEASQTDDTATSQTATSQTSTCEATTSQPGTNPVYWTEKATKLLIAEMKISKDKGKSTCTKKKQFIDIAEKLAKSGHTFTWEQVQGKWKTLTTALKRTKEHNNKSGNETKKCPFQKELEDIFEGKYFMDLPEEVLVYILQYIPVTELLFSVRKVNKRLFEIINNNGSLFVDVIFDDDCYILDEDILRAITKHARHIKNFQIPCQTIAVDVSLFNTLLSSLAYSKSLTHLYISECQIYDISFMPFLKSLNCLNLSCTKIDYSQLKYLNLPKLTYLYLSFNNLSLDAVLDTVTKLGLEYLDIYGIPCTYEHFVAVILSCPSICGVHITFQTAEDKESAVQFIRTHVGDKLYLSA